MSWLTLTVFTVIFLCITALGFAAANFRSGDLTRLTEWGVAGRRFGPVISWFLLGGDVYTTYTFMAVPALIFSGGAIGFFAVPYTILVYPLMFLLLPRFWTVARHRGYVTVADFVAERFGSKCLAICIAVTGILAMMPYIALQMLGIQIIIAELGLPTEAALLIAFSLVAAYTYTSGIRAPALIALVKDISIWIVILTALIFIPLRLGGLPHVFTSIPRAKLLLQPTQYSAYATLAIGSALAMFLYPHTMTGLLASNSRKVVRSLAGMLPGYTLTLGLTALLGYVALAAHIPPSPIYQANGIVPELFVAYFPDWFTGFALASLTIGALVPAAMMSIGAANLFTRSIYREIRPTCTEQEEASAAKLASLFVKVGALAFILLLPSLFAINFQLLGGIWILQTLPAIFLGLYTNWFHRRALLMGWATGMIVGTVMTATQHFQSVYPLTVGSFTLPVYAAVVALLANLSLCVIGTPLCRMARVVDGIDATSPWDYAARPVRTSFPTDRDEGSQKDAFPPQAEEADAHYGPIDQSESQNGYRGRSLDPHELGAWKKIP